MKFRNEQYARPDLLSLNILTDTAFNGKRMQLLLNQMGPRVCQVSIFLETHLAIQEVLSVDLGELLGYGQVNGGLGPLFGRLEEALDDELQTPGEGRRYAAPDAAVDHARVQAVGRDSAALELARQFHREHHVRVLGHVVQVGRERGRRVWVGQVQR